MESGVVGIVSHIVSSAAAGTRSGRQSRRSATWTILALCFCLYVASPCHGAVSADIVQGVKDATEHLGSKFDDIRAQVLGADLLAVRLRVHGSVVYINNCEYIFCVSWICMIDVACGCICT